VNGDYGMMLKMLQSGLVQPVADRGPTGPRGINAIAAPESGGIRPYAGGANPSYLPITPQIRARFERRQKDEGTDVHKLVKDAAKYGVDWSYMLNPIPTYKHD
jgi:hypothetical protein